MTAAEERVLRPGVAPSEEPDRRVVALDDGVPAADDVPHADGDVLGLEHLPGMRSGDGSASCDLLPLRIGRPAKSGMEPSGSGSG